MKKLVLLFSLVAFSSMCLKGQNNQSSTIYQWEVEISFSLPKLTPEGIQYSVVDYNPIDTFIKDFNSEYLDNELKTAKDEKEKKCQINISIQVGWDHLFSTVKGSDVFLLTNKGATFSQLSDDSNTYHKVKKWLISKTFLIECKPYCFVIPLNTENGAKLKCELNKNNMISLTEIYQNKIQIKEK
jgi:hypothetical protein